VAPSSIFEIGCGSGALLRELSTLWPDAKCLGLDPALPTPDRSDPRLRLERGFVEDTPNDVGNFDLIIAVNVIEHTPSPRGFLASLQSRLATGGRIVIICPSAEPPNHELMLFDHLYSLTVTALGSAVADTPLVLRRHSFASAAIGAFQMVTFENADGRADLPAYRDDFHNLTSMRQSYLDGWAGLDQVLLDRTRSVSRLVAFGGGETAALLRAYAPRTWTRVELIVLDDVDEAWSLDHPVASFANAVGTLGGAGFLIATTPRVQSVVVERLQASGLQSIRWDDLIMN